MEEWCDFAWRWIQMTHMGEKQDKTLCFVYQLCKNISVNLEFGHWHYETIWVVWYLAVYQQWIGFILNVKTLVKKSSKLAGRAGLRENKRPQRQHWENHKALSPLRFRQDHQMGFRAGSPLQRGEIVVWPLFWGALEYSIDNQKETSRRGQGRCHLQEESILPWLWPGMQAQGVIRRRKSWRRVSSDSRPNREGYHKERRPTVRLSKKSQSPALDSDLCFLGMHTRAHVAARSGTSREGLLEQCRLWLRQDKLENFDGI